eukprot:311969_1
MAEIAMNNAIWQFQDDFNGWTSMSQTISDNIQIAMQSHQNQYQFNHGKYIYKIDFTNMTQTNASTNKSRPIRYHTPQEHDHESDHEESILSDPHDLDNDFLHHPFHQIDEPQHERDRFKADDPHEPRHDDGDECENYQWQCWVNDESKWCDYDTAANDQLESCYLSKQNSCLLEIGDSLYEVHLDELKQVNVNTEVTRQIQRITPIRTTQYRWQCWLSDQGKWCDYSTSATEKLEHCYQSNQNICYLRLHGNKYQIDVQEMIQINSNTNVKRAVQRIKSVVTETEYVWEWRDDDRLFKRYAPDVSNEIELMYLNHQDGREATVITKQFGSQCYQIRILELK